MDASCKEKEIQHGSHEDFCKIDAVHQIMKVPESSREDGFSERNQKYGNGNGNHHNPNGTWEFKESVIKV